MSELSKAWSKLEAVISEGTGFVRLRLSKPSQPAVYAGRRRSDGFEAVLLEVETTALPSGLDLPKAHGLEIRGVPTVSGHGGRTCFHVVVSDERYRGIFATLALDVVANVLTAQDDKTAVNRFVARIEQWQSFLRKFGPEGLSDKAQLGLFGELWLLEQLLDEGLSDTIMVNRWRGPDKDAHDFQLPAAAVEVKTTKTGTPMVIPISGVKQLDDRGLSRLFLYFLQVEESASAELSLPELVRRLRNRLNDACRNQLDARLFQVGYVDQQFDEGTLQRYTVRRQRWFQVTTGFPRLLEPDLPAGVVDVRFSVALAHCAPHERKREDVMSVLSGQSS